MAKQRPVLISRIDIRPAISYNKNKDYKKKG